MNKRKLGAILLLISPFVMWIPQIITELAWKEPAYNPVFNWISDNGVPVITKLGTHQINSPFYLLMNIGFVSYAIVFFIGYMMLKEIWLEDKVGKILPLVFSVGVILIGLFPGYAWRLVVFHALGALMFLLSGNILLVMFGRKELINKYTKVGVILIALSVVSIIALVVMMIFSSSGFEGLMERISIYAVMVGISLQGLFFLKNVQHHSI